MDIFKEKYIKYKLKYIRLKQSGGLFNGQKAKEEQMQEKTYVEILEENIKQINDKLPDLEQLKNINNILNVYTITLEYKNITFILEPFGDYVYYVSDQGIPKLIVFYKLIQMIDNKIYKESIIPYYVSDGQTNQFRAGMLFPFICINEQDLSGSSCPSSKEVKGLLYKYHVGINIDMKYFNDSLYKELSTHIEKNAIQIDDDTDKRIKKEMEHIVKGSAKVDLASVLKRIRNLLDFLIAIFSDRFFNYDDKNIYDKPEYKNEDDLYYRQLIPPGIANAMVNNYNYDYDYEKDFKYNSSNEIDGLSYDTSFNKFFRNKFRYLLREIFFNFAKHVVNSRLINIKKKKLVVKNISLKDLNDIINICLPKDTINPKAKEAKDAINPKAKDNFRNYLDISRLLSTIFWIKLNDLKKIDKSPEDYKYYIENKFFFDNITQIKHKINISDNVLENNINNWSSECKKV